MTDLARARPVGRPCVVCAHDERSAIEADLLDGKPISIISNDHSMSISSVRRHFMNHVRLNANEQRDAGLSPAQVVVRLAELAARLQDALDAAEEAGRTNDIVRVSGALTRLYGVLLDHGVDHEKIPDRLAFGDITIRAVSLAAKTNPEAALAIAAELERGDHLSAADQLRDLISKNRKAIR
jgi:hypothetical protein